MKEQVTKDNKKRLLLLGGVTALIAVALIFLLTGCGSVTQDDIVGTWNSSYTGESGAEIEQVLVFEADGTYSWDRYLDGEEAAYDNGTYELDGKKLILHSSVDGEDKECKVSGGSLEFFDDKYTKAD